MEEGKDARKRGREEGREEVIAAAIAKMAAKKMSADEIAAKLELDIALVRKVIVGKPRKDRK